MTGLYIRRVFEPRSVAIVATIQDYSDDVADHVRAVLRRRFEGPVIPFGPETFVDDVTSQIRRMSPDVVFFAGYAPEAWEVFGGLRAFDGSKLPFVTGGGAIYGPEGRKPAGRALLSCACTDVTEIEGAEAFVAEYRARHGVAPGLFAADGLDGANVVVDALGEDCTARPGSVVSSAHSCRSVVTAPPLGKAAPA